MIKAATQTHTGTPVLLLGLTAENLARLGAGWPVRVSVDDIRALNLPELEIFLHYGHTEAAILAELAGYGLTLTDARAGKGGESDATSV
jgi:hypothetical protein